MKHYTHLFLDLDGTLSDSAPGIVRSAQYALEAFGIHVDNLDDLLCFVGPPLEESFQEFYNLTPSQADEAVKVYRRRYEKIGVYENALYPGIPQFLDKARQAGKVLMVATSKPQRMADLVLSHFGIADRFAFVGGREDSSRRTKEEVIRYVMKENGLTRTEDIVMIGDRKHDVLGAKVVGLDSVGVLYGYGSRDEFQAAGATYIVDTLKELEELLLA
mgnify:FL=1